MDSSTYLTGDALGSVVAEVSASAAVTERTRYQPFGTPMSPRSGPGYTGHVMDRSGLIYMQGRYYDPDVGRFLGMDPVAPSLADGGDFNRYAYARNNPYRYTDSTGQYVETAWDVVNVAIGVRSFGANVAEGTPLPCTSARTAPRVILARGPLSILRPLSAPRCRHAADDESTGQA